MEDPFVLCIFALDCYKQEISPENGLDYAMLWTHISEYKTVVTLCYSTVIQLEIFLLS
jgi:hypothetical protein